MKVINPPKKEKEILASVKKDAAPKEIYEGIVAKGEPCVNHLCGCNCSC